MLHHLITATSCFPNCHPAGQPAPSGTATSGYAALGFAFVLLAIRFLIGRRGGK